MYKTMRNTHTITSFLFLWELDHFVCFCDCALDIYIVHNVVYKVWDYSCLLLCITSFCLSPHGPHTVCSECDERQWMIDAHRASTHLLCSSGGVLRDAQPLWEVLGCGKLQLGRNVETPQLSNSAFTNITSSLGLFLQPHQTFLRRGLFTGKGSRLGSTGLLVLSKRDFKYPCFPTPVNSKSDLKWMWWLKFKDVQLRQPVCLSKNVFRLTIPLCRTTLHLY